jgi:circadian clock protein KaiC
MSVTASVLSAPASTGVPGLDEIMGGGVVRGHLYLVQGQTGTGKTTLALQFLLAGVHEGESGLYFTLAETAEELQQVAGSHGWSLASNLVYELSATSIKQTERQQTVFPPSEIELDELFDVIVEQLQERRPQRVVFDPITEVRLLADSSLRYRRQILLLRQQLLDLGCTTLFLSDEPVETTKQPPISLVHGVISLMRITPVYGPMRRSLEVTKLRGVSYAEGYHDLRIRTGGLEVYPRIQTAQGQKAPAWEVISSGINELDTLVGGGLETGTACLLTGQSGTGKTTVATLYVHAAIQRGESAAVFLFDERSETWRHRAAGLGFNLRPAIDQGILHVRHFNTGDLSPGEFAYRVRELVEEARIKVLVIDSLSGYLNAMAEEQLVIHQMHDLLTYLGNRGVLTLLVVTQHGILGMAPHNPIDLSYLADTVLLLRHFEAGGAVRQAISVLKKRYASHERTIRELQISAQGIYVSAPLSGFRGVLTGNPTYGGHLPILREAEQHLEQTWTAPAMVREGGDVQYG